MRAINTKGTNFWIMFICFTFVNVYGNWYLTCVTVRFDLVKSPEVNLCGWLGCKPLINNNNTAFSTTIRTVQDMRSHGNRPALWCRISSTPWMMPLMPWRPWMAQRMMMGKRKQCSVTVCVCALKCACNCSYTAFTPNSQWVMFWLAHRHTLPCTSPQWGTADWN